MYGLENLQLTHAEMNKLDGLSDEVTSQNFECSTYIHWPNAN